MAAAVLSLLATLLMNAQPSRPVLLLVPGHQFPEWAPTPSGKQWYGVYASNGGYELKAARVTFAPINACGEPDAAARRITVPGVQQPDFLVRASGPSLPLWRTGALGAAMGQFGLNPGEHKDIQTDSGTYRLAAAGSGAGANIYDLALRLSERSSGTSQVIFSYTPPPGASRELRPGPRILWIGDLDRDGRPDLVLEDGMSEVGAHYVLLLSSARRGRELVRRVAEFSRGSC